MPHFIKAKNPVDAWVRVINKIMDSGMVRCDERGIETRWLDNVLIHVMKPFQNRVSPKYHFSEKVLKEKYATQLLTPDRLDFEYTYGERLNAWGKEKLNQIDYVISKLRKSPYSRRAVATTWDPRKDPHADEIPCLNHFVFMVRQEVLDLSVTIRSNDMYGAWPANLYALGELLRHVAGEIGTSPGSVCTLSVNAHIYSHDYERARDL